MLNPRHFYPYKKWNALCIYQEDSMVWKACYCTMPPYDQRQSWKILRLCLTLAYSALNDASCTQRHSCVRSHINSHSKNKIKEKKSLTSCIQQQLVKCRKKKKKKCFLLQWLWWKALHFCLKGNSIMNSILYVQLCLAQTHTHPWHPVAVSML